MNRCAFCGRDNDPASRFCIDCGKPVVASGARVIPIPSSSGTARSTSGAPAASSGGLNIPSTRVSERVSPAGGGSVQKACPYCATMVDASLPFCPKCGGKVAPGAGTPTPLPSSAVCGSCGKPVIPGADVFCARCGARVSPDAPPARPTGTAVFSARAAGTGPKLAILDADGNVSRTVVMDGLESTVGRADGELRFGEDVFMSPVHAQFALRDGVLIIRDLGSRNGTWVFLDTPHKLQDGDTVLVGSQILRFRRLGYPGPNPPEADATRRLGSFTPSADVAVLQQLRADGSARDSCHLSPGRSVVVGRAEGDWLFPYDKTMSGKHAEVRGEDLEFIVMDLGSRNGIAVSVRGERVLKAGQRVLMGDQTIRVESL